MSKSKGTLDLPGEQSCDLCSDGELQVQQQGACVSRGSMKPSFQLWLLGSQDQLSAEGETAGLCLHPPADGEAGGG